MVCKIIGKFLNYDDLLSGILGGRTITRKNNSNE